MRDNAAIVAIAATEALNPTIGTTQQFLEVHSVAFENGVPKVAGISIAADQQLATVYFAVADQKFCLAVSVSLVTLTVEYGWVEDYHRITFHATSESLDVRQLLALTSLTPAHIQKKGDARGNRKWPYRAIEFEPNPEPGPFEDKLEKLLSFLEQDPTGARALVDQAEGYVRVISEFYNGNTSLGGIHLNKAVVRRLAALNLEIDFDLNAVGEFYN